ncbi:MAG: hypothetical protein K0S63_1246, partial [Gammaproteobacteria bacterium]|nr:hypothetical protein [Gammaproteobacteria bacterium]
CCDLLDQSITLLLSKPNQSWEHPKGIYYRLASLDLEKKRVVALFPGQGSQYLNMASKLVQNYPEIRKVFENLDDIAEEKEGAKLSSIIFPTPCFDEQTRISQKAELIKTQHAQPAICAVSMGIYKQLHKAGFQADFIVGHSLGELTALWAAGGLEDEDFLQLTMERGRAMAPKDSASFDKSAMLAIMANEKAVVDILPFWPDLQIANYNAPNQIVVGGSLASIQFLQKKLSEQNIKAVLLPVSAAFHTPFVAHAEDSFQQSLMKTSFRPLKRVVYSNVTSEPYPSSTSSAEIQKTLAKQIISPVLFQQSIEKIHRQGGYLFVEIGPKNTLSNLVKDILKGKDYESIAVNPDPEKDGELQFRQAIVQLMVAGVTLKDLDPYQLETKIEKNTLKKNLAVKLNGGFYLNPPNLKLRREALEEKSNLSLKNFLTKMENPPVNQQNNTIVTSLSSEQYFHKNQATYLSLMEQLIQNQKMVIERMNQHPDFAKILDSLNQTQMLLEKNQAKYGNNSSSSHSNEMPSAHPIASQQYTAENAKSITGQGVDAQQLIQRIKQLIAQRANCSVDALDLKADLELGLGLDLFKMLEVSAAIHEEFSIKREILDKLFESSTIADMIRFISSQFGNSSTPGKIPSSVTTHYNNAAPAKNTSEPKQEKAVDPAQVKEVTEKILEIVSQETGYPTDVLEVNMDLSAELGVDSIKMVQILGAIQTQYPELGMMEEGGAEDLTKLRTIEQIAQHVSQILALKKKELA